MSFSSSEIHSCSVGTINFTSIKSAPCVDPAASRYSLGRGILQLGPFAGQHYQIAILNPHSDAAAAFEVSEDQLENQRLQGKENVKPRSFKEIEKNMSYDLTPGREKGGLVVGLLLGNEHRLVTMGGIVLINDPKDGGRGSNFAGCLLKQQIILNMAITHPAYENMGLTSLIFTERLNIVENFAEQALDKTHVITKVAGIGTKTFYTGKKAGFLAQEGDFILKDAAAPDNRLTTLYKPISELPALFAANYPDFKQHHIPLNLLHENHKSTYAQPIAKLA